MPIFKDIPFSQTHVLSYLTQGTFSQRKEVPNDAQKGVVWQPQILDVFISEAERQYGNKAYR